MTMLGKYELHEQLGRGGFGAVYRAVDTSLNREVALKVLHPQLMVDNTFVERFKKEAFLLASLEHPNIVTIYDLGETDGRLFIAMQYLAGGSLQQLLRTKGPLPFERAREILEQVCAGLQSAHAKGLVHRDIKPANILFDKSGRAVVSDFGLARAVQVSGASSSTGTAGTPAYRAPELWRGKPPASPATDVYSLGCVLAEMLTGKELFGGSTPDEIITRHLVDGPDFPERWPADMPEAVIEVLRRSLSREPGQRQQNAEEFFKELNNLTPPGKPLGVIRAAKNDEVLQLKTKASNDDLLEVEIVPGISMQFVRVPAGEFLMGSPEGEGERDENPQHSVYLDEYWIGKYPVTNQEYQAFVQATAIQPPGHWKGSRIPEGRERHPVVNVTWENARDFCKWLSSAAGMEIHLPSEAQWEKAARGMDGRVYPWGNQEPDDNLCNWDRNVGTTTIVGKYSPGGNSPCGCADMAGNVWEWAADWYGEDYYRNSPSTNPTGPYSGEKRVLRGGSWNINAKRVRSALRIRRNPSLAVNRLGFRCALSRP